jgi:hypothetical protein
VLKDHHHKVLKDLKEIRDSKVDLVLLDRHFQGTVGIKDR